MLAKTVCKLILVDPKAHKLLLIRRSQTDDRRPGQWDLPGGMAESDETLEMAVARECQEETKIDIDPLKTRLLYTINDYFDQPKQLVNWLFFVAYTNQDKVSLSFEHDQHCWVSLATALELVTYDRHKLLLKAIDQYQLVAELMPIIT